MSTGRLLSPWVPPGFFAGRGKNRGVEWRAPKVRGRGTKGEGSRKGVSPPRLTGGLGKRREILQRGPGWNPATNVFLHISGSGTASGREKNVYHKAKKCAFHGA